ELTLGGPVADLPRDGQRLVVVLDGLLQLAEVGVGVAQVAQCDALAAPVADLAGQVQGLLEKPNGSLLLALLDDRPQAAPCAGLPAPVAGLARDAQGLLVAVEGPLGRAELPVVVSQAPQGKALPAAVAGLAGDLQGPLVQLEGLLHLTEEGSDVAEV